MSNIRIKPQFSVVAHSADMVELKHGVWNSFSHLLNDDNKEGVLAKIILGLQAQCNLPDVAKNAGVSRSKVEAVLDYLQQLGVLQSKSESFIDYYVDDVASSLKQAGKTVYDVTMPVVLIGDEKLVSELQVKLRSLLNVQITYDSTLFLELEQVPQRS